MSYDQLMQAARLSRAFQAAVVEEMTASRSLALPAYGYQMRYQEQAAAQKTLAERGPHLGALAQYLALKHDIFMGQQAAKLATPYLGASQVAALVPVALCTPENIALLNGQGAVQLAWYASCKKGKLGL